MNRVVSKDGTPIAYDKTGQGPAVILVGGALSNRLAAAPLAALLSPHLTVFAFDRRGKGDSGDTPPYAVEREVEDVSALIQIAGGSAFVFGTSSGAVLSLHAAAHGLAINKLAVYEPPFIVDNERAPIRNDFATRVSALLSSGKRGDAVTLFMTEALEVPAQAVDQMRNAPMWAGMEKVAHTLPYEFAILGNTQSGSPAPLKRWLSIAIPTLVMAGGASPAYMRNSAQALADVLPHSVHRTLDGQTHSAAPAVLAPVLIEFFSRSKDG